MSIAAHHARYLAGQLARLEPAVPYLPRCIVGIVAGYVDDFIMRVLRNVINVQSVGCMTSDGPYVLITRLVRKKRRDYYYLTLRYEQVGQPVRETRARWIDIGHMANILRAGTGRMAGLLAKMRTESIMMVASVTTADCISFVEIANEFIGKYERAAAAIAKDERATDTIRPE
jgi:hypothetical protein